tara:strand:+ start:289 stop:480 length:192 start_codon:yes stop_codon:yes gene_type:complete
MKIKTFIYRESVDGSSPEDDLMSTTINDWFKANKNIQNVNTIQSSTASGNYLVVITSIFYEED